MSSSNPPSTVKSPKINILGVGVDDISRQNAIYRILTLAQTRHSANYVVTVNPEFVMLARKNRDFLKILNNASLSVADGVGVVLAKLILGGYVHNRITGVELVETLCKEGAKKGLVIGFLGGFATVAEIVAKRQKIKNPKLKIAFAIAGDPAIGHDLRLRKLINSKGRVDILFVAYGMGKQEYWIERNKNFLNVGVLMGVGGAFDYLALVKKRAPKLVQTIGLEWLLRLFYEPVRIRRMMVLPHFAILVIKEFFTKKILKIGF